VKTTKHIIILALPALILFAGCTKTNTVVKPVVADTTTKTPTSNPTTPVPVVNVVINIAGVSTSTLATGFNYPTGMAIDKQGNVFVADALNNCIRKITPDGKVSVVVGQSGTVSGYLDGDASVAQFYRPSGVVIDDDGNLYVADTNNQCIRKITPAGVVSTFVNVVTPIAIARDVDGNLYTSQFGYDQVIKITPDGHQIGLLNNVRGDGMVGVGINFAPAAVAVDAAGNVYESDYPQNFVHKIAPDGTVTSITLNGPVSGGTGNYIDGALADAHFHGITGLTVDASGNIYVADWGNNAIRVINTQTNTVKTLAGNGSGGSFSYPEALAVDASGNIYVAEPNAVKIIHH
jgi:sugar lactone lactonase YvrE